MSRDFLFLREKVACPLFLPFFCPTASDSLAGRRLCGEKTVRKVERARLLSEGEESEALIRVAFDSPGQKQRVLEPYSRSLSSMVAAAISQNLCLEQRNQLLQNWKCYLCYPVFDNCVYNPLFLC
jgi:hypothetical protein